MVLGLLAPELVVWNAWEQRKQAQEISAFMRNRGFMPRKPKTWLARAWKKTQSLLLLKAEDSSELQEDIPHPRNTNHTHTWTNVHSWYLVMGGFAFEDTGPEDQRPMPTNRQRIRLTLYMFRSILDYRPCIVPDVSRESIEDKSKSDRLGKLLTLWQTTYFCISCIFRLSQSLSITLLELNVFAQAMCALLLFTIWWEKPRDIQEPTLIRNEEGLDACAYFFGAFVDDKHGGRNKLFWCEPQPLEECFEVSCPTTFHFRPIRSVWRVYCLRFELSFHQTAGLLLEVLMELGSSAGSDCYAWQSRYQAIDQGV